MLRCRSLFCALLAILLAQGPAAAAQEAAPFAGLDTELEKLRTDARAAGFAVAVVKGDQIIWSRGFGYRDAERRLPVTPHTLFAIGSVTKSFTASLIGLLEDEGQVSLDEPVVHYLPTLQLQTDALNNGLNLRHMMSHQSGLPRHDLSWYLFPTASRDSVLMRLRHQEPTAPLRARWQYNNFMYTAQGALAEKLTGQKWEVLVSQRLMQPLRMTRANFTIEALQRDTNAAKGYSLRGDTALTPLPYYAITAMGPAGAINTSVTELAAWVSAWIGGGKYEGRTVLPSDWVKEAITAQAISGIGLPDGKRPDIHFAAYGLGWGLSSYRGHYRVSHGGNIDGFSAAATFFPTDSVGIVVLSNMNASPLPGTITNMIADRLLSLTPYDWAGLMKENGMKARAAAIAARLTARQQKKGAPASHPLGDYAGAYSHPGYGTLEVAKRGDSLFARAGQQWLWLRHSNHDVFHPYFVHPAHGIDTTENPAYPMQFSLSVTGEVDGMRVPFEPGLKPLEFKRSALLQPLSGTALKIYEGDYVLGPQPIRFFVRSGNTLILSVPGQPEYILEPVGQHAFALKGIPGFTVRFTVPSDGRPTEAVLHQPNGVFAAKRKG